MCSAPSKESDKLSLLRPRIHWKSTAPFFFLPAWGTQEHSQQGRTHKYWHCCSCHDSNYTINWDGTKARSKFSILEEKSHRHYPPAREYWIAVYSCQRCRKREVSTHDLSPKAPYDVSAVHNSVLSTYNYVLCNWRRPSWSKHLTTVHQCHVNGKSSASLKFIGLLLSP